MFKAKSIGSPKKYVVYKETTKAQRRCTCCKGTIEKGVDVTIVINNNVIKRFKNRENFIEVPERHQICSKCSSYEDLYKKYINRKPFNRYTALLRDRKC